MRLEVLADPGAVAARAAEVIALDARAAVSRRGRFSLALSGGRTPWAMIQALIQLELPWAHVRVLQVDERIAPAGHADRNWTGLSTLLSSSMDHSNMAPMPVEAADLDSAVGRYQQTLAEIAGRPPVLDLVHLGLGVDGHTASLIPGDAALDIEHSDVAMTGEYQGRRRMTLTYPVLNRARHVLWVITGGDKAAMLARLLRRDPTIPAGRVSADHTTVIADRAAASDHKG